MINITAEQFEQLLPFVGAASEDVFTKAQPSLENVYFDLVATVIGEGFEDAACAEDSPILGNVRSYVILKAFILRLRSNDLIMTDNGFGVVSNENISPASQARIEALLRELTYKQDQQLHGVLNRLRTVEGWSETMQASNNIASFFWSPQALRAYSTIRGLVTFDDLAAHRSEIGTAELMLRKQFSDSLIEQLLEEERKAQYEPFHRNAIVKMCHFIGAHVSTKETPADPRYKELTYAAVANFIEENIDKFPKYKDSSAYKANHTQAYENKADDPTFFFAG